MTAQIRGMTQAACNANDGISLAQTAEGNLNEINNNLQRIRELAVQAANDVNGTSDRTSIQKEIEARLKEIDRVAASAKFNETSLLSSTTGALNIQVGANDSANDVIVINTVDATTSGLIAGGSGAISVSGFASATGSIGLIDDALVKVDTARSELGVIQNRLESTVSNLNNTIT